MKLNLGISDGDRAKVAGSLKSLLADEIVLTVKTRNFHWNVTGAHFNDLHKFFEAQYESLEAKVDEVAERIRQLGYAAPGSLAEFVSLARLKETKGAEGSAHDMVARLLADHESVIRSLRSAAFEAGKCGDAGTEDFLVGLMEDHEKMAWMLRATAV